ncbi:hypothetical protein [Mycobacterium sp.]|uniref:hypothetical protein n=1 Tax=Mycobacterium sp. TaxID=1785 RepID=UPI003F97EEF5
MSYVIAAPEMMSHSWALLLVFAPSLREVGVEFVTCIRESALRADLRSFWTWLIAERDRAEVVVAV